jgi:cell division protein FtsL
LKTPYAQTLRRAPVNSYLRRERDQHRRRELALVVLALTPLAIGLLGYTWVELQTLSSGYRRTQLEQELHTLQRQERLLSLEAGRRGHPARIEALASEQLGMRIQTVEQTLSYETLMAVPAPPLVETAPSETMPVETTPAEPPTGEQP